MATAIDRQKGRAEAPTEIAGQEEQEDGEAVAARTLDGGSRTVAGVKQPGAHEVVWQPCRSRARMTPDSDPIRLRKTVSGLSALDIARPI